MENIWGRMFYSHWWKNWCWLAGHYLPDKMWDLNEENKTLDGFWMRKLR